jgi:oligo-alginate lyase
MRTMAELPNWYPKHFLDTAEGALGMATGLDWLHDALTTEERAQFASALVEKALKPGLLVADEKSWVSGSNNWTAVCHGGLVSAALAIAEREPALAKQTVDRALKHMPHYAELYAPVGAYSEGPDYWAYGTTFYALLAESLRTALGTTVGLERAPGFLQTADYTLQMTAPSGLLYNFGDNSSGLGYEPVMFWFARELRRGDLITREVANLKTLADAITAGAPRGDASRMLALALVWRESSLPATPPSTPPLVWWSEGGSQPQAVLRSKWDDPRATFVGIKAGQADDSHAHMDIGSFILEADGVRWAVDLGRESYPHARANGMAADLFKTTQASKRWIIFRCGPESHNLLRFDGAPQLVAAKAEIRPLPASATDARGFSVDLSPVVRDQVSRAERRVRLHPDRSVSIEDEWTTRTAATHVTFQWLTRADVTAHVDGATLRQNGETLRLRFTAAQPARVEVEDVSAPRNRWDSPNPGLRRIVIHLDTPAATTSRLRVTATPGLP